jgi:hypothetical protein
MFTIHTNLVGAVAKLKSELPESGANGYEGKEGEIVAVYLDNSTIPRFLLAMNPSTSHKAKHPLIEVVWHAVEWVKQSEKKVLLCE